MSSQPLRYVAFLRAINVGGRRMTMAELRLIFTEMGFTDVESFIASGNIMFCADNSRSVEGLERDIEAGLQSALGYAVATFVREPGALAGIADAAFTDISGSHQIGLMKAPPGPDAGAAALALQTDNDLIAIVDREVHWLRRDPAKSRLSNGHFERALGVAATFRSVSMVRRITAQWADESAA